MIYNYVEVWTYLEIQDQRQTAEEDPSYFKKQFYIS